MTAGQEKGRRFHDSSALGGWGKHEIVGMVARGVLGRRNRRSKDTELSFLNIYPSLNCRMYFWTLKSAQSLWSRGEHH